MPLYAVGPIERLEEGMMERVSRPRLSNGSLQALGGRARLPAYERGSVAPGIVHLGVGAFHRAHQAVYVDDCLGAGETGWGIVGASLRSTDTRDALAPQDNLFGVVTKSGSGDDIRIVGAITDMLVAPEDPAALVAAMADPRVRIVTLTVTEKAYLRGPGGRLDTGHADIGWDIANPDAPRTVHGFLAAALRQRRAAGTAAFTVLCCDNLPANGATVRRLLLEYLETADRDLAAFVADGVAFPSTMVDRIVPATTDADRAAVADALGVEDAWPVMTEPFMQWVIEDHFPAGRPRFEDHGAELVRDVGPYEDMKLRLLNGAHSAIAYLGLLTGHATVSASFGDPRIRRFVEKLWAESSTTLPASAGLDPDAYARALAERFSNPALVHRTAQIATDGSQKLPQRILAPARDRLARGDEVEILLAVLAAWIACCRERGRSLPLGHFTDPLDTHLPEIFASTDAPSDIVRRVFSVAGFDAPGDGDRLQSGVVRKLASILERGPQDVLVGT
jgi:fructuronate reductase